MALTPQDLALMRIRQQATGGSPYAAPGGAPGGAPVANMASTPTPAASPGMAPGIDPRTAFLMSAGGRLLQGMAPSTDPANQSMLGNIGGAIQAGMPAYQGAVQNQMQRKMFEQQQAAAKLSATDAAYLRQWYEATPTKRAEMKLPISIQQKKTEVMLDPSKRYKEVDGVLYDLIGNAPTPVQGMGQGLTAGIRVLTGDEASELLGPNYDPRQTYMRKKDKTIGTIPGVKGRDEIEKTFRAELKPSMTAADNVVESMNKINAGLDAQTGLGDLAAINSYQRLIDPAVVRGEDVELIRASTDLLSEIKQWQKTAAEGDILPQSLRDEMKRMSGDLATSTMSVQIPRMKDAQARAGATRGARWDHIVSKDLWGRYQGWRDLLPKITPRSEQTVTPESLAIKPGAAVPPGWTIKKVGDG